MNRHQASVARETIDLLFSVVRKECILSALHAQGISEEMVREAIASLEAIAAPPPESPTPAAIAALKRRRHRRGREA